jgi:uncharacterized integral membrane protein
VSGSFLMRKFITFLILVPIAVVLVIFAVANRQLITVSLDPFDQAHPALDVALPLFALLLGVLIVGVVIGGAAAWIRQSKWRRAARLAQREARELNAELTRLREQMGTAEPRVEIVQRPAPRLVTPPPAA